MPIGLVIMHWDERVGVEILAAYPEEMTIAEKTLMQLYSQHEFTGEAGMVSMMAGATNLASYYTGTDSSVYVILVLNADEDGDVFEEGLIEISNQIMLNLESGNLPTILPPLFQRLSVYPTLTGEQQLAMIYNNLIKRSIIKRLQNEAAITKSEIAIWLKDEFRDQYVDVDGIIAGIVKAGLIKIASVKGLSSDVVFLVEDFMMLRRIPTLIVKDPVDRHLPEQLKATYLSEVRNFFQFYHPDESDSLAILDKVILDPAHYEVLKLLREAVVTRNDLEKLKKKGVDDVDRALKAFWECKMIAVFQDDKQTEYICLVSDFYINKFFPRYNLDTILSQYRNKSQNPNALLKALDLLREEFYIVNKLQRAELKEKQKAEKFSTPSPSD